MIILSALGLPRDRVDGLDAGAEDYLSKPFDVAELLARMRALRRRHRDLAETLAIPGGRLVVPTGSSSGERTGDALSDRECSLLEALARRPQQIFSRSELVPGCSPGLTTTAWSTPTSTTSGGSWVRRWCVRSAVWATSWGSL